MECYLIKGKKWRAFWSIGHKGTVKLRKFFHANGKIQELLEVGGGGREDIDDFSQRKRFPGVKIPRSGPRKTEKGVGSRLRAPAR